MTQFKSFLTLTLFLIMVMVMVMPSAMARDPGQSMLNIQEVKSASGLTAWLVEDHSIPVISLQFTFQNAGAVNDPADKQGLVRMLSNTMDEGAGDLDSQDFQQELRDKSISLGFRAGRDHFGGNVKTLSKYKARAFEMLKFALNTPRFDTAPVQRMRAANQSRIRSSIANPDWIAARIKNDRIFEGDSYAMNTGGTLSSLNTITVQDLRDFHKNHIGRDNLVVGVAGDITAAELATVLDDVFAALPNVQLPEPSQPLTLQNQGKIFLHEKDIPQTIIEIVQPGIDKNSPDYHKAQVMNYILGASGFGSRLMEEIREKRGLTYGIYSYYQHMDRFNGLNVGTSTENKNVPEMLSLITTEWDRMKTAPPREDEIKAAVNYLTGSLPLSLTSTDKISGIALSLQNDNLPIDYLDQRDRALRLVTAADVQNMAQSILNKDQMVTILVGNPDQTALDATVIQELPNVE